jgi:hypothetical protein
VLFTIGVFLLNKILFCFSPQASDKVHHLLQLPASSSAKERSDTVLFNPLSSRKRRNSSFLAGAAGSTATVAAAAAATAAATSGETGTYCIHFSSGFCVLRVCLCEFCCHWRVCFFAPLFYVLCVVLAI